MMTKKDFEAFAALLRENKPTHVPNDPDWGDYENGREAMFESILDDVCVLFADSNSQFDGHKFREAVNK